MINLTLGQAVETISKLQEENKHLKKLLRIVPPERLELLADHFDMIDKVTGNTGNEVQTDLRHLATECRKLLQ